MFTAQASTAAADEPIRIAIATPLLGLNSRVSEAPPAFHDHVVSMLRIPGIAPVGLIGPTSTAAREAAVKGCGHVLYLALNLTLRDSPEPPSDYAPAGLSELVKEHDGATLRFGLYGADHQRQLFDKFEAYAKTDGEDIITPLLVKATGAVANPLKRPVQPAQRRIQPRRAVTLRAATF